MPKVPSSRDLRSFPVHPAHRSSVAYRIPVEVAQELFDAESFSRGGGWAYTSDGLEVYGCRGSHEDGATGCYYGWIVHSFGGMR